MQMERKLYRYRSFKDDWKEEAFDGIVEPSCRSILMIHMIADFASRKTF